MPPVTPPETPNWDEVLSAAARLQTIVPGAVLAGGTAAALVARHRFSQDADHVGMDLRGRFDDVLADLEQVAGWSTARIRRPVLILGSLDGIETGVRQLVRSEPLETMQITIDGQELSMPTPAETLRIKCALILKQNAVRDYVDVAALSHRLGMDEVVKALGSFDELYPQPGGQSAMQQLIVQLNAPSPYDLDQVELSQYRALAAPWTDWTEVVKQCAAVAAALLDAAS